MPVKGCFGSLMLVVRERFEFCRRVNVWPLEDEAPDPRLSGDHSSNMQTP